MAVPNPDPSAEMAMKQQKQPLVAHSQVGGSFGPAANSHNRPGILGFKHTKAYLGVEKWLGGLGSATSTAAQEQDDDVVITRVTKRHPPAAVLDTSIERPGMRTTSWGGNRDEDVKEIAPPRQFFGRKRDVSAAVHVDENDNQGPPRVPMPPAKKPKTSHNRPIPTTLRRPERGDQQLRLLQQAAERQQEAQAERAIQQVGPAPQQPERQALQVRAKQAVAKTSQTTSTLPVDFFFKSFPVNLRNEIYRHLLVSQMPISVMGLWTESTRGTTRRGRRGGRNRPADEETETFIDARILGVCKQAHEEGARVLYSENTFLYKLRDVNILTAWNKCRRGANTAGSINFVKYGHLFRYMSLELENNRKEAPYEQLMALALKSLVNGSEVKLIRRKASHTPSCTEQIRLHTLTITISPEWNDASSSSQDGGKSTDSTFDRSLSIVKFFGDGHDVMMALRAINTSFIRINLHVQRIQDEDDEDAEEEEDDDETTRHLETTIDLRYHPSHLASRRKHGLAGDLLLEDPIIQEQREALGMAAENALSSLRKRIVGACTATDEAVEKGWWEDHEVAEDRRREHRLRLARMFEGGGEEPYVEEHRICLMTFNREKVRAYVAYRNYLTGVDKDEE
ncbi:hypothetical protein B0T14DRAFT_551769 [Immersiella caudata]|uniref:Uncharacterized protein n=1 Tax=Immersiella caudata TaxID=314043 RepID=A0AA40C637_9PEZI|nr:hypothetical protein B0T14DRAFT_551769 [Immersiella caudata]